QPAGSKVIREQLSQGVRLVVPPTGFRHPNVRHYMLLGLGCLAVALAVGGFLYAILEFGQLDPDTRGLLQVLWLLPVVLGIGTLGAIEEVVRRAPRHPVPALPPDTPPPARTHLHRTPPHEGPPSPLAALPRRPTPA